MWHKAWTHACVHSICCPKHLHCQKGQTWQTLQHLWTQRWNWMSMVPFGHVLVTWKGPSVGQESLIGLAMSLEKKWLTSLFFSAMKSSLNAEGAHAPYQQAQASDLCCACHELLCLFVVPTSTSMGGCLSIPDWLKHIEKHHFTSPTSTCVGMMHWCPWMAACIVVLCVIGISCVMLCFTLRQVIVVLSIVWLKVCLCSSGALCFVFVHMCHACFCHWVHHVTPCH